MTPAKKAADPEVEALAKQFAEFEPVLVSEAPVASITVDVDSLTIYQRMDRALAEITDVELTKSKMVWLREPGTNHNRDEGKGYSIVPIADILKIVRRIHGHWGIKTEIGKVKILEKSVSGSIVHVIGTCKCRLIGKDDTDVYKTTVNVEAKDSSDKLYNKLRTNALRNLYRTVYNLDGDESQDPEEVNTPAPAPKKDSFFDKPFKGTPVKIPAKKDDAKPDDAHKEAVTDRPREVMVDTIFKASRRAATRGIVTKFSKTAGDDPHTWSDEVVADCYAEICDTMKEAEE